MFVLACSALTFWCRVSGDVDVSGRDEAGGETGGRGFDPIALDLTRSFSFLRGFSSTLDVARLVVTTSHVHVHLQPDPQAPQNQRSSECVCVEGGGTLVAALEAPVDHMDLHD